MRELVPTARNSLMVAGLIAIAALVYWPSTIALWGVWTDPDIGAGYAHGLLVGLLSLWLLLRARHGLDQAGVCPVPWAYPLLLLCSIASIVFWRAGIHSLYIGMLPLLMLLAIVAALGIQVVRVVAFPLTYLYFAMPGWGILAPSLQGLTVRAVGVIAPLVGLPAHVVGSAISLPGVGVFEVTPACSGVNFLVVGLAVAALIGELGQFSLWRRVWLLAIMGAVAIASNWMRALLIIAIGYATDMRLELATRGHLLFGWVIFATALLIYVWWATARGTEARSVTRSIGRAEASRSPGFTSYLAAAVALAVIPCWAYVTSAPQDSRYGSAQLSVPVGRGAWMGPLRATDGVWRPVFVGEHSERRVAYVGPASHRVEVVAIGYSRQEQGRELVSRDNSLLGDDGLTALNAGTVVGDGLPFRELIAVDSSGQRSLIWSVYDIGGRTFVNPLYSQLWYGIRALDASPYSALLALRTACEPSCRQARTILASFVQTLGTDLFASVAREPRAEATRGPA